MKVEVKLINEKGRDIPAKERTSMPTYRGLLRINERRSPGLGRIVPTAQLVSITDGSLSPLLPELHDAMVLYVRNEQMRIRGFEHVGGVQYGQTWDIKVQKC